MGFMSCDNESQIVEEFSGDHSKGETPDPIPNSEVKPFSADGTAWETVWESRTSPNTLIYASWFYQEAFLFTVNFFVHYVYLKVQKNLLSLHSLFYFITKIYKK